MPNPKNFPVYKTNPVFDGLPEALKDPAVYYKIERALLDTLATPHSHSEMLDWFNCVACFKHIYAHKELMKRLGFQSPKQYYAWKKTMEFIHQTPERRAEKKGKLKKYND